MYVFTVHWEYWMKKCWILCDGTLEWFLVECQCLWILLKYFVFFPAFNGWPSDEFVWTAFVLFIANIFLVLFLQFVLFVMHSYLHFCLENSVSHFAARNTWAKFTIMIYALVILDIYFNDKCSEFQMGVELNGQSWNLFIST